MEAVEAKRAEASHGTALEESDQQPGGWAVSTKVPTGSEDAYTGVHGVPPADILNTVIGYGKRPRHGPWQDN